MNRSFLFFVLASLFVRIVFSLNVGLIDDEAYHWSWSQILQLSYFDHPAMIAWLEAITTSLFGQNIFAVRLPSFVCYLGFLFVAWKLAKELFGLRAGQFVVILILWTPFWGFGGYISSPETPFMLCWILAAWVFWQGVREDGLRWSPKKTWLYLGLLMGLGLNSKFIIALLAPGFGIYLLLTPSLRKILLQKWPWIGFLIATLLCLPIFIWNIQFDWPGFKYQFHDRHSGDSFSIARWLGWWGAQWGLVTPPIYFFVIVSFIKSFLNLREARWRFLFSLTLPSLFIFSIQPFFADYKPHWAGAAYLLLCLPLGSIWEKGVVWKYRTLLKPSSSKPLTLVLAFLIPFNLLIYSPFIYPWWPIAARSLTTQPWKTTYDLSNEFYGWPEVGTYLLRRQREIHSDTGQKPFLAALRYETTAQTWWGTKEPIAMISRDRSHYTVYQEFYKILEPLKGSDSLVLTTEKYSSNPMDYSKFDSCKPEEFKFFRARELSRIFTIWHCKNFQGVL